MRRAGVLRLPFIATLSVQIVALCLVVQPMGARAGASVLPAHAALAAPAAETGDGARVVAEKRLDARTLELSVASPALGRTVGVRLLLPDGWSRNARRAWPVLWLLHGGFDDYTSWTAKGDAAALTASGAGRKVLVVMPEGGSCGWYSDWWNRGRGGPPGWETFHLTELRTLLERDYGAGARRAIAGPSMGGFGAMSYAARHPGMFEAAASFSGAVDTRHRGSAGLSPPLVIGVNIVFGCGQLDWERLWGDPVLDMARWKAHNPRDLAENLRGMRLYVASGDGRPGAAETGPESPDPLERAAYAVTRSFVARLDELSIPVTTHFYAGTHAWAYWRQEL